MRKIILVTTAIAFAAALAGCVTYPVYPPPIARLTPAQSAALAARPLDPAERDRLARLDAQVQREDQADIAAQRQAAIARSYAYVAPTPFYTYGYPYYGYPYYGYPYYGYSPWVPGISFSFGYRHGWGGHHGGHGGHWRR